MGMICSVQQKWGESVAQGIGGWSQRVHLTNTTYPLYVQGKIIEIGKKKKNWLSSKSLPKVIGRGFDYTVLVNMVQAPWMLESDIFLEL